MAVKIRLMRIGARSRPFYRIVAVDERRKRTGGYLDLLGTYNPLTEPKDIKIDQTKLAEWKKKGAILSDGFLRIIGEAKQRKPRKTKKEKAASKVVPVNSESEQAVVEEPVASSLAESEAKIEEKIEDVTDVATESETAQEASADDTASK